MDERIEFEDALLTQRVARRFKADDSSEKQVVLDLLQKVSDSGDEATAHQAVKHLLAMGDPKSQMVAKTLDKALKLPDQIRFVHLTEAAEEAHKVISGLQEISPYQEMGHFLDTHMKPFKKGHAWWLPPHNFAFNSAIMNVNFWYFTILPFGASKMAYRPKSEYNPEGIVIDPSWVSFKDGHDFAHSLQAAELGLKLAKGQPTVSESVKHELAWIANHFKVEIPSAVASKLEGDALKIAERKWGTDRLRNKKILVPFDGSKSIEVR